MGIRVWCRCLKVLVEMRQPLSQFSVNLTNHSYQTKALIALTNPHPVRCLSVKIEASNSE